MPDTAGELVPAHSPEALEAAVLERYEAARYVDAHALLEPHGGLDALTGSTGRALAGRLATNLGGDRYGVSIHLRAWRQTPDANALAFFVGMATARLRGPVHTLDFLDRAAESVDLSPRGASDLHSCRAYQFGALRDYAAAEDALATALSAEPDRAWLAVTRGYLLRIQDRPRDAIAAVREALAMQPWYRPAVQSLADALVQQNEVDEARQLLIDASERLQSGSILLQLASLERELGEYESARTRVQAALPMLPLRHRDRDAKTAYAGLAATLAYDLGDLDEAIRLGEEAGGKFHETVAANLREHRDTGRRVVLDVGFTLQRDVTCAPATIATLTKFWGQPVPEVEIADAICYDGTPAQAEREWIEERGFFCREFTLTWEAAVALIDAGVPFTQSLAGYGMGHMQAVIGYDSRSGVLVYRDPNVRHSGEVLGRQLLEQQRSAGPRGLVFVPESQRERIEALDLPDHELWTLSHRVSVALERHRRNDAVRAWRELRAADDGHRLTLHARARIASYDGDLRTLLKLTDRLLERFPDDQNQWSVKVRLMRTLGSRSERLAVLDSLCGKPDVEAVYQHQLIEELLDDPDELPRVDRLLRRQLRIAGTDGQTLSLAARRAWLARDPERALTYSRYAACVDVRNEGRVGNYFSAAVAAGRNEEALALLRDRFDRFANQDAGPAMGLVEAFDQLLRHEDALRVLNAALNTRPEDGELRLYASNYLTRLGRLQDARKQLDRAEGRCHPSAWLAAAARLARSENRLEDALEYLQKSLERAPLDVAIHRTVTHVIADLRGVEAAAEHLRDAVKRYPNSIELRAALVEFSVEISPEAAEAAAREHLERHPEDAWAQRELGFRLIDQRRWDEAMRTAERAERYDPGSMNNQLVRALAYAGAGKAEAARDELTAAVRESVDYTAAVLELFRLCDTREDRRAVLGAVLTELKRQVIRGDSLHAVRAFAARTQEPDEALFTVREARDARPDLPQTWSVVVTQLREMGRLEDAEREAREAVERFPLVLGTRLDLATVLRADGRTEDEVACLREALAINSRDGETLRYLAEAYARQDDTKREKTMLERARRCEPRNITHRGALAEFWWRQGERDRALREIHEAVAADPDYEWGWNQLTEWSFVVDQPKRLLAAARATTDARPESPRAWLQRADVLARFPEHADETHQAIRRVLQLDPRSVDAHETLAGFLANQGRFDEAIAACSPTEFGSQPPMRLTARAAAIQAQRGELDAAIAAIRGVLDEDPHYAWAWSQLSNWLGLRGDKDGALEAARRLLGTAPNAPASWGYVAECLAATGDLDGAKEHLKRSIELDASYLFGGHNLLTMQIEAGEFDDALATLATIGPHLADHERLATEARVHALKGSSEKSIAALRRACRVKAENPYVLIEAVDAMLRAGWAELVKHTLRDELDAGRGREPAAVAYVEVLAREARLGEIEQLLDRLDAAKPVWAEAASAYVDALGDAQAAERLEAFVRARETALRKQTRSWGLVGSALQRCGRMQQTVGWMLDYAERRDVEPYQLAPLAIAMIELGDNAGVRAVVDHGAAMPLAAATDTLRVLAASADVLDGNAASAAERLAPVSPQNLSPYYEALYQLEHAAALGALQLDGGASWGDAWSPWREAFASRSAAGTDAMFHALVAASRQLLTSRRGNPVRRWLGERTATRLRRKMVEAAA